MLIFYCDGLGGGAVSARAGSIFLFAVILCTVIFCMTTGAALAQDRGWRPGNVSPVEYHSDPFTACERSWRAFNGDGPYGPTVFKLSSTGPACWRPRTSIGVFANSYGSFGTTGYADLVCPSGEERQGAWCQPIVAPPAPNGCLAAGNTGGAADATPVYGGNASVAKGNPIEIDGGDKVEHVVDYAIPGARPFEVARTYRSRLTDIYKMDLGLGWSFDHEGVIRGISGWNVVDVYVERGGVLRLKTTGSDAFDHYASGEQFDEEIQFYPGDDPHWIMTRGDGRIMRFDRRSLDGNTIDRLSRIE